MPTTSDTLTVLHDNAQMFAKNFYNLTGAHMGIHDMLYNISIPSGLNGNNLCAVCKKYCWEFVERCQCDDKKYLDKAAQTKQTTVFRCHLGATSVIIPVVEDDVTVGVIDFGMIFVQPDETLTFEAIFANLMKEYPEVFTKKHREELQEAYNSTCTMTVEQLRCYITLVTYSAQGLYLNTLFSLWNETSAIRLRNYVALMHPERIPLSSFSVAEAADRLNFSCSHLTRLSEEIFGMPLKQYILHLKMECAKKILLQERAMSVCDVAAYVGIEDPKYFSRIFRQKVGCTCKEYRASVSDENVSAHTPETKS